MKSPEIPEGTNVVGVGIDQIEVSRIRDSLEKHGDHFLKKIFSENEQSYCEDKADPAPCLAARFAAKEAVAKAFGTGFGKEFGWLDSEIIHGDAGEPILSFNPRATELLKSKGAEKALVSLSHLEAVASAIVILVSR
ncbi:holo-ACP synthase [Opitutales bacterium]|jgi:holo-[acyl-carrier protein] synthase|nr:holo-ACP synthase [Opitutales bacterium]